MKKQFTSILLMALLMLTAQAGRPDFKQMGKKITTAILAQTQAAPQAGSRAAASRLIANSYYYNNVKGDDSSHYYYYNNYSSFDESSLFAYFFDIWPYDSVVSFNRDTVDGVRRRTFSNQRPASDVFDYSYDYNPARYTYGYDGLGRIQLMNYDTLIGAIWSPTLFQYRFTYNGAGKVDSFNGYTSVSGVWTEAYRSVYTYSAAQLVTSYKSYELDSIGVWKIGSQEYHAYNGSNQEITRLYYETDNGIPYLYDSTIIAYPSANIVLDTTYYFEADTIEYGYAKKTIKNVAGKPLFDIDVARYDAGLQQWTLYSPADTASYQYNSFNQETVRQRNYSVDYHYYETYNAVSGIAEAYTSIQGGLFPNPAQDLLNITFQEVAQGAMTISIYNVNGQLVQQTGQPAMTQTQINIGNLASGTYTVSVINAGKQFTGKFIKAK